MKEPIAIIENEKTFSTFHFYNDFIKRVAQFYTNDFNGEKIEFILSTESFENFDSKHYIDPIALPLLVSLAEQLKIYHNNEALNFHLINTPATINFLEFLYKSDFFHLVGKNINPTFPKGKNIFNYNEAYLGGFKGSNQRSHHKIRGYSLVDDNLTNSNYEKLTEEEKKNFRDTLVEYYTYKVQLHFSELLHENIHSPDSVGDFIEILSELITNGVLHSKSDVFALMFSDRFNTKFSISDNGIGFLESLNSKEESKTYKKFEIFKDLGSKIKMSISQSMKKSILSIFEALYYSMLKDRYGLFDLMCKVVIENGGYFRLHNENAQIIISHRMINELLEIYNYRTEIIKIHNEFMYNTIDSKIYNENIINASTHCKDSFIKLALSIFDKYNSDAKFSSLRFYEVKFKGVHIEVEIPNTSS